MCIRDSLWTRGQIYQGHEAEKNQCELIDFEAANHSFFNFNVSAKHFEITLNSMDAFVVGLGYIEPMEYV